MLSSEIIQAISGAKETIIIYSFTVNASTNYTLAEGDNNKIFECNAFFQVEDDNSTATGTARIYILEGMVVCVPCQYE